MNSSTHLQVEDARPREGRAQVLKDDEPVGDVVQRIRDVWMAIGPAKEKEYSKKRRFKHLLFHICLRGKADVELFTSIMRM